MFKSGDTVLRTGPTQHSYGYKTTVLKGHTYTVVKYLPTGRHGFDEIVLKEFPDDFFDAKRFQVVKKKRNLPSWF